MGEPAGHAYDCHSIALLPISRDAPPREAAYRTDQPGASAQDDFVSLMAASMMDMPALLNTASSPVSPGQSSPQQAKPSPFVPPARPSSTPFPHPENRNPQVCCLDESDFDSNAAASNASLSLPSDDSIPGLSQAIQFEELPMEVHEAIVDHLFGFCISPTSSSAMRISSLTRSWGSVLRHSRRRELANLALVNRRWTFLIQQRLYRHIKLKATIESVENAVKHLASRPYLAHHVKHVEIWFPVFQPMYGPLATSNSLALPTVTTGGLTNATYILPENNCTLAEVFRFLGIALPEVQVLTLEGGERRRAPKVIHSSYRDQDPSVAASPLCPMESVRTLVTRGQWNLMREHRDFANVLRALPNLEEWQGSYSKPKSKSYITLSEYMPSLPRHVKRLGMCMENDYRREAGTPPFYYKVATRTHICISLGQVLPRLEHFSFTGRVCHKLFDLASRLSDPFNSRLKSIDLTVKNCCPTPDSNYPGSGSGIHEMGFIEAFEKLVVAAIRFLEKHKGLQYLRIRFVDLDSLLPPLNPYFLLRQQRCTGVWSDLIVTEMARVRPDVSFAELSDSFGNIMYSKEGRMIVSPENPRTRISSLKLSNYQALANRMTIQ
ncbi:hypothetical protein G6O67_007536 [Ophiocordyceps sinensis]|uniref:Uncharacterized protein n=1 Tax=Ophiocordyceps sinensis TaxID=72228 RepID=A0A8H4LU47_9HYPO|nr:hypothetical protein G6O67_007536 [Ophiocordyceps sinensis]